MATSIPSRRGAAGRIVFWLIALAVIGCIGYFIWKQRQPVKTEVKPPAGALASYMAREHVTAWESGRDSSFTVKDITQVEQAGRDIFGQDITFAELEGSGMIFQGGREADVPGPPDPNLQPGRSAHFRLESDGTKGPKGARTSVFIQKYVLPRDDETGDVLKVKTAYTLKKDPSLGANAPDILVYRQGGLVYYLVSDQPGGYDPVKAAFAIPDSSGPY